MRLPLILLLTLFSCVPYSQQTSEREDRIIASRFKGNLVVDPIAFNWLTIALRNNNTSPLRQELMRQTTSPTIYVVKNFLLFEVEHGGTNPYYELLWDGNYEIDKNHNTHVYLIYRSELANTRNGAWTNNIAFDLSTLQSPDTHQITIHLYDYKEPIVYNY